jgi:mRNA-degrading endonuclease RelE of RelBE toxin-antitoxin system
MNWDLELARAAQRALREIPARDRERINRALNDLKTDPFSGDVSILRGAHQGLCSRRVGSWRIIFELKSETRIVLIGDIVRRTSTTY